MNSHSLADVQERAALYALGALNADERGEFETHLRGGCDVCASEVRAFRAVADELTLATDPEAPRSEVRARVLHRLEEEPAPADRIVKGGLLFVHQSQSGWQPGRVPGSSFKVLHHDPERLYRTHLVRMAPGAAYPAHRHGDVEELYLLEGDLEVGDVVMHAGDYCRAEAGTIHSGIRSDQGCLFIAMFSDRNELL